MTIITTGQRTELRSLRASVENLERQNRTYGEVAVYLITVFHI